MFISLKFIKCRNIFIIKPKGQRRLHLKQLSWNEGRWRQTGDMARLRERMHGTQQGQARRWRGDNLHLNLSMIFPPHSVANAILTANTEILPWPSLFNDSRKKKMLFRVLPVKNVDIFYSVEIVGYMAACNMQTHFRKGCEYNSTHIADELSDAFVFQETSESPSLFTVHVTCSKYRPVAREICPR